MDTFFDYAIIGGDKRLVYAADILAEKNFNVITYKTETNNSGRFTAVSLEYAVNRSENIICPIPLTRDKISILSNSGDIAGPDTKQDLSLDSLKNSLTGSHKFFAGCIPEFFTDYGKEKNIFMYDFMKNEELAIFNTIATAEGALAEAIKYHPANLHAGNCLVLGFGRCAKTLAAKLKGLSANVTVCARNKNALAEANAYGYGALELNDIEKYINRFEYIFNTIPTIVLPESTLAIIRKDALLLDVAPGGFDFEGSRRLGLNSHLCPGLPGKYSPKSSAEVLVDLILQKRT